METLLSEYFPILVFLAIAGAISAAMVAGSLILARQRPNKEKLSPYECGFDPFDDARIRFSSAASATARVDAGWRRQA